MRRVLILGASGLVGGALINELKDDFDVYGTYFSKTISLSEDKQFQLGARQTEKLKEIIRSVHPDIVISCLRGEFDQQFELHEALACEVQDKNVTVYFFSTTNVFDGDFSKSHIETDTPIAESDYGKYKIKCENMLKEILGERAVIIRIPAIWGKDSPRWNSMKESIQKNEKIEVYSNLECNNLLDIQLAKQLHYIIKNELKGIFHLGSIDTMTQAQFYEQIIGKLGIEKSILQYRLFLEKEKPCYFCLESMREEIPSTLRSTNMDIIDLLVGIKKE